MSNFKRKKEGNNCGSEGLLEMVDLEMMMRIAKAGARSKRWMDLALFLVTVDCIKRV